MFLNFLPQQIPDATSYALVYIEAIILGMLAAGMPAYFAMDHTRDREVTMVLSQSDDDVMFKTGEGFSVS